MLSTLFGIYADARAVHPENAPSPIIPTLFGISMAESEVQNSKAPSPIFFYGVW